MKKHILLFLCFAVLNVSIGYSRSKKNNKKDTPKGEIIEVVAEGFADIRESGFSDAVDRAYLDAQHKAVETALGKVYSARTVVEAGRYIEQKVYADVKGYIKNWEKISGPATQEYPGTKDKIVWVKIKASIGLNKLKSDTGALLEIQKRLGSPDVAVFINNKHALNKITEKLKAKKFIVKDIDMIENEAKLELALENDIEIVIEGVVTTSGGRIIMKGVDMRSYQANIVLKALNSVDGIVLAEASSSGAYPHINPESGKAGAVEKATDKASDELIDKLLISWEDSLNNGNNFYLKIGGLTLKNEADFKFILKRNLRGLKEVFSKGFKEGIFSYKLKYLGDVKTLAKDLSNIKGKFKVEVKSYRLNTVKIKALEKEE